MARSVATSVSAPHPDWHSQVPRGELGVIRLHNPWPLYHVIWCQEHERTGRCGDGFATGRWSMTSANPQRQEERRMREARRWLGGRRGGFPPAVVEIRASPLKRRRHANGCGDHHDERPQVTPPISERRHSSRRGGGGAEKPTRTRSCLSQVSASCVPPAVHRPRTGPVTHHTTLLVNQPTTSIKTVITATCSYGLYETLFCDTRHVHHVKSRARAD